MTVGLSLGDLLRIRALIVGCTVLAAFALALALAAHLRLVPARETRLLAEQDLRAAEQRLARMDAEHREYLARLERYREIARRHSPGAEGRLEWLAQLRKAAARRHVSSPEADFAAQVRLDPGAPRNPELRANRMHLRMDLLHEDDLLGLLADLRSRVGAYLRVRACSIERVPAGSHDGDGDGIAATLRAECSIDWLSLHEET